MRKSIFKEMIAKRSIKDLNQHLELIKWIKGMIGLQEQQNPISDEVQKWKQDFNT
jgi:hypothetical protein